MLLSLTVDLIDVTYSDPIHGQLHVVVSSPFGGGGNSVHVTVNDYFKGQIVRYNTGWVSHVQLGVLTQDDIDAIIDVVAGNTD